MSPALLLLALGVTVAVVAWGYLVYAAIDFGSAARGGEPRAWAFLGLAALGAVACLFVGLMLIARLLRRLGISSAPATDAGPSRPHPHSTHSGHSAPAGPSVHPTPRPIGGRRASR